MSKCIRYCSLFSFLCGVVLDRLNLNDVAGIHDTKDNYNILQGEISVGTKQGQWPSD